ncbi:MAG: hypothetical protein F6K21_13490 [Symploca sp. SIO2D2]|nr:hypothetical protein [Symploca sp. SIO2D2]
MNITKTIANRLFVGFTAFSLIVASSSKEVNAHIEIVGNGGSTGWNKTSSNSESACLDTAKQKMNTLVNQGEIQTLPNGNDWRWRKGNNVILNVVCSSSGDVRVDVICFNACARTITSDLRPKIDELMKW